MKISEHARMFREASTETTKDAAREALAKVLLERSATLVRARRVPSQYADDASQDAACKALSYIERGQVTPGKEDAFTNTCIANTINDLFRRVRARREQLGEDGQDVEEIEPSGTPETLLVEKQEQVTTIEIDERIRSIVDKAPEAYRAVLIAHYDNGLSTEELALEEVNRRLREEGRADMPQGERSREFIKVRNVVYQRLCRARRWVQQRALGMLTESRGERE